ncbi:hypothetical protein FLAVO9AF_130141 [Flavobacterium sp. 9AF]|uniref:SMI1/KNR4 family protein n=1 Tax=Flavobacterium sp. 9AF TaxID=2653142 RepID=UPI0012EF2E11|nr:SMI1/KNR4 family protein [Flavobacterium sp. 9AF]VXB29683.1 hypothetical protein FLAVO9AF_130141 [Flavobacterium sp. 9AF]
MNEFEKLKAKIELFGLLVEHKNNKEKWESFEKNNKINLPLDYKKYIDYYGTGCLAELIWILNPFSNKSRFNILHFLEEKRKAFIVFEDITEKKYPHKLFSEGTGIMPFAFTDNGDTLYWKINKNKQKHYNILIFDSRQLLIEEYNMSFSEFLLNILNKSIESKIINLGDIKGCTFNPLSFQSSK